MPGGGKRYVQATQAPNVTVLFGFCVSNCLPGGTGGSSSVGAGCNGRYAAIVEDKSMSNGFQQPLLVNGDARHLNEVDQRHEASITVCRGGRVKGREECMTTVSLCTGMACY